jgi:hypothetical protein
MCREVDPRRSGAGPASGPNRLRPPSSQRRCARWLVTLPQRRPGVALACAVWALAAFAKSDEMGISQGRFPRPFRYGLRRNPRGMQITGRRSDIPTAPRCPVPHGLAGMKSAGSSLAGLPVGGSHRARYTPMQAAASKARHPPADPCRGTPLRSWGWGRTGADGAKGRWDRAAWHRAQSARPPPK